MSQDLTTKVIEQQLVKIGRIETQMRQVEKLLGTSRALDTSRRIRRTMGIVLGVPLGVMAFVFIGFLWNAMNGTGIYIGITCAVILWMISRHILTFPPSDTMAIVVRMKRLDQERETAQATIRKYADEAELPEDAEEPTRSPRERKKAETV
jgi:hypothetical protein